MTQKSKLNHNELHFRSGEEFSLQSNKPDSVEDYERIYVVAQIETPALFGIEQCEIHKEHCNIAIIAAESYPTISSNHKPLVGWVHLGYDEKTIVGDRLLEIDAKNGEWFYMILDTRKHYEGKI